MSVRALGSASAASFFSKHFGGFVSGWSISGYLGQSGTSFFLKTKFVYVFRWREVYVLLTVDSSLWLVSDWRDLESSCSVKRIIKCLSFQDLLTHVQAARRIKALSYMEHSGASPWYQSLGSRH